MHVQSVNFPTISRASLSFSDCCQATARSRWTMRTRQACTVWHGPGGGVSALAARAARNAARMTMTISAVAFSVLLIRLSFRGVPRGSDLSVEMYYGRLLLGVKRSKESNSECLHRAS